MIILARPLILIFIALAALLTILSLQFGPISAFFAENLVINSLILGVFIIGLFLSFWRLSALAFEITWIDRIRNATQASDADELAGPRVVARLHMLAAFANVWRRFFDSSQALTPDLATTLVDSAQNRLDERRELSRYLANALLILGLLGTFWGLLGALIGMREALGNLDAQQDFFTGLSSSLSAPLESMGTAFSSTLFGLAASLLFGFIELQTTRAHSAFLENFEAWLATFMQTTELASDDNKHPMSTKPRPSIEASANIETLGHLMRRGQQDTMVLNNNLVSLLDQITRVADKVEANHLVHEKILSSQMTNEQLIDKIEVLVDTLTIERQTDSLSGIDNRIVATAESIEPNDYKDPADDAAADSSKDES